MTHYKKTNEASNMHMTTVLMLYVDRVPWIHGTMTQNGSPDLEEGISSWQLQVERRVQGHAGHGRGAVR